MSLLYFCQKYISQSRYEKTLGNLLLTVLSVKAKHSWFEGEGNTRITEQTAECQ